MLALAYSNDMLDIYDDAICYMFYRFFEHGIGMVWARILLPEGFDDSQVRALFKSLKIDQQRSFDYWSADSRSSEFAIPRYFRALNSNLDYWRSKSVKSNLIPQYQVRTSLKPVIAYNEPILFRRNNDYVLAHVHRRWHLAWLLASVLRDTLST